MIRDANHGSGSRIRILIFYPSRIPGVKRAPDPGSGSATLIFCVRTLNKSYDRSQKLMSSIESLLLIITYSHTVIISVTINISNVLFVLDPQHLIIGGSVSNLKFKKNTVKY
jgi:hypothetical protein